MYCISFKYVKWSTKVVFRHEFSEFHDIHNQQTRTVYKKTINRTLHLLNIKYSSFYIKICIMIIIIQVLMYTKM